MKRRIEEGRRIRGKYNEEKRRSMSKFAIIMVRV